MNLLELYDTASKNDVKIYHMNLKAMKAFSLPNNIVIDMSQLKTLAETKVCFAHELGHEMKSAFYTVKNTLETRERQEARADRWAVDNILPLDELKQAVSKGYTEIWELAEYFDVTEDFVKKALDIHNRRGDLLNMTK